MFQTSFSSRARTPSNKLSEIQIFKIRYEAMPIKAAYSTIVQIKFPLL